MAANCFAIATAYRLDPDSRALAWLPLHHDMGLVGHILLPMWLGMKSSLMDPLRFLQRPLNWLRLVGEEDATITSAPNFAYEMCAREAAKRMPEDLNLSGLMTAICGGEPVLPTTARRFVREFEAFGFSRAAFAPSYGLAEATLLVSTGQTADGPQFASSPSFVGGELTDLGPAVAGLDVRVLGADGLPVEEGEVGRIEVAGKSVGKTLGDDASSTTGQSVLTGDLGFLKKGHLFVTGREKELIIVRGQNVYAADVESAAMSSSAEIVPGGLAAIGLDVDGTQQLVVLFEIERHLRLSAIESSRLENKVIEAVAKQVGTVPAQAIALRFGTLPRTSSGKIQRRALAAHLALGANASHAGLRSWAENFDAMA